jgi:alkylation response protein AidB-like acyl-CoA dehydrogenase
MYPDWNPEFQHEIARVRHFAEASLSRRAEAGLDRQGWQACAGEKLLGLPLPASWDGASCSALETVALFEALGRGGADRGLLFALGAHLFGACVPMALYGGPDLASRQGRFSVAGSRIFALAITEPSGGSHISSMETTARLSGGGYVLRGEKRFVTNAPDADLFLVLASTSPERGTFGLTAFLVPKETPGLEVRPLASTLGLAGAPMGSVYFQSCELPAAAVLGKEGGGFAVLGTAMQWERTCILAGFLGAAERDLARCVARMRRSRGGHPAPADHQAVAHRLAGVKCGLEAARAVLYRGASALDLRRETLLWPSLVKRTLSETLTTCAQDMMRLYAGAGWADEDGAATAWRDTAATLSASGTNDVQLNLIASCLRPDPGA